MKIKKTALIAILLVVTMFITVFAVDETNNDTGTETGLGQAAEGDACVRSSDSQQATTMWKISVWVAKNDNVTQSSDYTLTNDYYQFGSTFWIYRKSGDYAVEFSNTDYIATLTKEEYLRGADKTFRKGTYSSLKSRIFAGESVGFSGSSAENRVPYVPNCGSVEGLDNTEIQNDLNAFFKDNANTSNILINLAARAAGYKNASGEYAYVKLLNKMISDGKFTVNSHVIAENQFNLIDPYRAKISNGVYEDEASSLAWVIMYEPMLRFAMSTSSDSEKYYVTASDVAALMCQGLLNFCTRKTSGMYYRFSPAYRKSNNIYVDGDDGIYIAGKKYTVVSKNCTTPFFVNLANSLYLSESWLGYDSPKISSPRKESDDLWSIGNNTYAWYADTMLERAGFGLRYQKSNVECVEFVKTVTIEGGKNVQKDYSGFQFEITDTKTNEKYYVDIGNDGVGKIQLRPGTYTVKELASPGFINGTMTSSSQELISLGNGTYKFTLTGTGTTKSIAVENSYILGSLTINKQCELGCESEKISSQYDDTYFKVTGIDDVTSGIGFIYSVSENKIISITGYNIPYAMINSYTKNTDVFSVTFSNVPCGKYRIEEICENAIKYDAIFSGLNIDDMLESSTIEVEIENGKVTIAYYQNKVLMHKIIVNYIDKYTGELIGKETIE